MPRTLRRHPHVVAWAAAAALAITFALDLALPPGVAVSVCYVAAVLLGFWAAHPRHVIVTAVAATVLDTAGVLLEPRHVAEPVTTLNHLFSVLGIWSAALVTWWNLQLRSSAAASQKELGAYKGALDQSAIVAITDRRGVITYVNDKFCEISKYSRDELLGQDHRILNSGHHPREFFTTLWSTIGKGQVWRGEIRNRAKDGTIYWVDTVIIPFLGDDGKPVQHVAIRSDITEKKRAEQALFEQQALARLGAMAAVVAHEVRNPLAGIAGALQIIGSRLPPGSAEKPIVAEMLGRIDALDGMVRDLLQFARPRPPRLSVVDLREVARETAGLLTTDPTLAGVGVEVESDGDDTTITADPDMVRQLMVNLVLNAAQAMHGDGIVRVRLTMEPSHAVVAVADDGPGIPADLRDRVFEPFFTTKSRGTGLGLPLARRHAEAHGGSLDLADPRSGAELVLKLPRGR